MKRKAPKCKKGFPCGRTCISKIHNCYANLSTKDSKLVETYSQFINRLVGIGTSERETPEPLLEKEKSTNPVILSSDVKKFEEDLIKSIGDESYNKSKENLKRILESRSVSMNFPSEVLEKLLEGGKFKNQWETGTSYGSTDLKWRSNKEKISLGVDPELPPEKKPIYGHMSNPDKEKMDDSTYSANSYGDIRFMFKDSIKERTTITLGDSPLNGNVVRSSKLTDPKPLNIWKVDSLVNLKENSIKSEPIHDLFKGLIPFIEAQIYGETSLNDVASAFIPKEFANKSPEIIKKLQELYPDINIEFYK